MGFEDSDKGAECFKVDIGGRVLDETEEELARLFGALAAVEVEEAAEGGQCGGGGAGLEEELCLILV